MRHRIRSVITVTGLMAAIATSIITTIMAIIGAIAIVTTTVATPTTRPA